MDLTKIVVAFSVDIGTLDKFDLHRVERVFMRPLATPPPLGETGCCPAMEPGGSSGARTTRVSHEEVQVPDCHNPAGRLLKVFAELGSGGIERKKLAHALGAVDDWGSVFNALVEMPKEYDLLEVVVSEFKDNPPKAAQYKDDLVKIKKTLDCINISCAQGNAHFTSDGEALTALKYMAIDLPQEETLAPDEIEKIRKLCDELRNEIEKSQTLTKALKEWLLDLVRMMRDGIARFKIRGSRGFSKELYEMLGSILIHYEDSREVVKKEPGIWTKMMEGVDWICRAAERFEKVRKTLAVAYKMIAHVSGGGSTPLQLPGPKDDE